MPIPQPYPADRLKPLALLQAELLALDSQLRTPPRPMPPALAVRLEAAHSRTLQEIETRLRATGSLSK